LYPEEFRVFFDSTASFADRPGLDSWRSDLESAGSVHAVLRPSTPLERATMRKFVMSLVMVLFLAGLVFAVEVTVLKYDSTKKEVTVMEGEKEKTYTISDDTKVSVVDKDGNAKEAKLTTLTKRLENEKSLGKMKMDITVKGKEITEVKIKGGKKKQ
jgi:hypothetical protein